MAAVAYVWPLFLAGIFVFGLGFGGLDLGLNQVVAYSEGRRRAALLNALNSAYPAGAVAGPLLVAAFASEHFSTLFLAAAAAWLILIAGALSIRGRLPVGAENPRWPGSLVAIFVVAFVLYVAVEAGTGGWMTSHLESLSHDPDNAAALTSGFWLALVAGRLLITLAPERFGEARIVLACCVVAAASLLLAWASAGLAAWAYIACGLALAPIFPTGIVWLAKLRPGDSRATSWMYPAASAGGIIGPAAIGVVIAGAGVAWVPAVLGLMAVLMTAAFVLARRSMA
jgi:fucose permease